MDDTLKNTDLIWVDQPHQLQKIAEELAQQDVVAIDTESNSLYAYQEQVCLIQFSTRKKDILIDSLALTDLSPLAVIFKSNDILKVFHAAEYDLICLTRDYGFEFNRLFDTMVAARILGFANVGLGSLLEQFFGIQMNKKYQRANWGKRPINPEMLAYARQDSHYLIELQEYLRKALKTSGAWELAQEDFKRLTQGIEDTTRSNGNDFWKLRGARELTPENAAILKSLYQFRETMAERQNRPPFKVISHQTLVELSRTPPENWKRLVKHPSISESMAKRYGKGLLNAILEGKKQPPEYPPQNNHLPSDELERIDALRKWRKNTGERLGVPSDVILPRDVMLRIASVEGPSMEQLKQQMWDVPYRFSQFGDDIKKILQKGGPSQSS